MILRSQLFDSFRSTVARSRDFLRSLLERPSVGGSPSCRPLMRETIEVRITDQTIIKLFHAGVGVAAHTQPAAAPAYDDCRAHAERASPSRRVDADRAAARSRGGRPGHHRLGGAHPHRLAVSGAGVPSPPWNPAFGADYGPERLEAACQRGMDIGVRSYGSVQSILRDGLDRAYRPEPAARRVDRPARQHPRQRLRTVSGSRLRLPRALLGRLARASEVVRRVDQGDVRERLREVSNQAPTRHVIFLGEQAHVVAQS